MLNTVTIFSNFINRHFSETELELYCKVVSHISMSQNRQVYLFLQSFPKPSFSDILQRWTNCQTIHSSLF